MSPSPDPWNTSRGAAAEGALAPALRDSSPMIHAAISVLLLSRVGSKMAEAVFGVNLRS